MRDIAPVAIGAAGALATDVAIGFIPLPAAVETSPFSPWIKTGIKAGLAIGAGWGVGKALGRSVGAKFTVGALTVIAYSLARDLLTRVVPTLSLGGLADSDYPQIGFAEVYAPLGELMPGVPALAGYEEYGRDFGMGEVFEH